MKFIIEDWCNLMYFADCDVCFHACVEPWASFCIHPQALLPALGRKVKRGDMLWLYCAVQGTSFKRIICGALDKAC